MWLEKFSSVKGLVMHVMWKKTYRVIQIYVDSYETCKHTKKKTMEVWCHAKPPLDCPITQFHPLFMSELLWQVVGDGFKMLSVFWHVRNPKIHRSILSAWTSWVVVPCPTCIRASLCSTAELIWFHATGSHDAPGVTSEEAVSKLYGSNKSINSSSFKH